MADKFDINLNINDNSARKSGAAGTTLPTVKDNSKQLAKELGKTLEKVNKSTNKVLASQVEKALEKVLRQFLLKSKSPQTTGGIAGGTGPGLTPADITKIINAVTKKGTSDLLKEIGKLKRSGGTRSEGGLSSGTDRQIQQLVRNLGSVLGNKGITLPPDFGKTVGTEVAKSISGVISKDFGKASQEAAKAWKEVKGSADQARKALESISKIKKSGGGIDFKEIVPAIKEIKSLGKSLLTLKQSTEDLSSTAKSLARDQKALAKETRDTIKSLKDSIRSEAQKAISDIPSKLKDKDTYKKQFDNLIKEINKVATSSGLDTASLKKLTEVGKDVSSAAADMKQAAKDIKDAKGLKETAGAIQKSGEKISSGLNSMEDAFKKAEANTKKFVDSVEKSANKIEAGTKKLPEVTGSNKSGAPDTKKVFDEISKGFKKLTEDAKRELKTLTAVNSPKAKLESFEKERQAFVGAIQSKDPQKIKDALGRGMQGVSSKSADDLRQAIIRLEKTFDKAPAEFAEFFKKGLGGQAGGMDVEKKLADIDKTIAAGNKQAAEYYKKTATPPRLKSREAPANRDVSSILAQHSRVQSALKQPRLPGTFAEVPVLPGKVQSMPEAGNNNKAFEKSKALVEAKMQNLSDSLLDLQKHIVGTLEKEFTKAGSNWDIVKSKNDKSVTDFFSIVSGVNQKTSGKQFAFEIANINQMKKMLFSKGRPARQGQDSKQIVEALTSAIAAESVKNYGSTKELVDKIGDWFKTVSEDQIKADKSISRVSKDFVNIKKSGLKGEALSKAIGEAIGTNVNDIEEVFKATIGKVEAMRDLKQKKLVRTVALPAARITKEGSAVFETSTGAKRALQKFAEFKTGFENIYNNLIEKQALVLSKNFAEGIRDAGVNPRGAKLDKARDLARDIITDFAKANSENLNRTLLGIREATVLKGGTKGTKLRGKVEDAVSIIPQDKELPKQELSVKIDQLVKATEEAGVSMYDVVKTMDSVKFLNVYDIMKKVVAGAEGGLQPLVSLGKSPNFQKSIRDFETSINQVQGILPLLQPGRPRSGVQNEGIVKLMSRTSDIYKGEDRFKPTQQKEYIKDLNIRFQELFKAEKTLSDLYAKSGQKRESKIPEDVKTIASVGIPGVQASEMNLYRTRYSKSSNRFLSQLETTVNTMYTDILEDLAPMGQFTQKGREGLSGIGSAMSASPSQLERAAAISSKGSERLHVTGMGTSFPTLRSTSEADLISSGRAGTQGYGFNVITEFKHVAGTMEDQILVSGKLADALTSITKNLIRPAGGGRVRGGPEGSEKVTDIKPGVLKGDIQKVFNEIQKVMGVPEEYRGRADSAFIDKVTEAISVIRGEEVEVQQARLTEVFLNSFGRKFFSRYGSKGVGAFATQGMGGNEFNKLTQVMSQLQADVKVLAPKERKKAGLGVALLPRSAGEMLADIFGEKENSDLRKQLVESGNKFILDLFKGDGGILVKDEAKMQQNIFQKASSVFEAKTGKTLKDNIEGLRQITTLAGDKGVKTKEEQAIDIRISSKNIAKRGLQPEFFEAMINNIAGVKGSGFTTMPDKIDPAIYKRLLGEPGKPGELSTIAGSMGFDTLDPDVIKKQAEVLAGKAKTPEQAEIIKKRAMAIEQANAYYTDVIDQFGEVRKGIVGEKFFSVVEEPGQTAPWKGSDIRRGIKGVSLDIPSFSAYATIFGEQSDLLREMMDTTGVNQKKQLEFIKALRVMADETGTIHDRMGQYLEKVSVDSVKFFEESTGVMPGMADDLDPRNLKNTVFDTQRFAKPFMLDIPKVGGEAGETEPFYIPGALARGTYDENLIAGEKGIENIGRRLQQVVNMSKKANELLSRPGMIRSQIEELQKQLAQTPAGTPEAAALSTELLGKKEIESKLLKGGEITGVVRKRITEQISEYLAKVRDIEKEGQTGDNMADVNQIYQVLENAVSVSTDESDRPSEVFRTKKTDQGFLPIGQSERQNLQAFAEAQKRKKGDFKGTIDAIRKAVDFIIGKGPDAMEEYNLVMDAIAELNQGLDETNSSTIKEIKSRLSKEGEFSKKVGTPDGLMQSLQKKRTYIEPAILATLDDANKPVTRLTKDLQSGKGIELATRFGINIDQELQFKYDKAMDNLQRAKIEYFTALAEASIGKKGAISQGLFRRTFPGVMKKATVAIVDRTEEMEAFKSRIGNILDDSSDLIGSEGIDKLLMASAGISDIAEKHKKTVGISRAQGMPVLKQHELGIPEITARKIPVKFAKKFKVGKEGGISDTKSQNIEGTLFDMLSYIDEIEKALSMGGIDDDQLQDRIKSHLSEDLKPFVEAVRYPFTGVSSVVPFKPKLLTGQMGKASEKTFVAPGIPDFNVDEFNTYMDKVREVIGDSNTGLVGRREKLQSMSDTPTPAVQAEIDKITETIRELRNVIDSTIPKYAAHTAKLDFDGDMIAVHSATTRDARKEIEDHYKTLTGAESGNSDIQTRFRSRFTSDAVTSEQMGTETALAEAQEKFLKKFPAGEGFEFLTKPFLTEKLEYAAPKEQLSILGIAEEQGMMKAFENLIRDTITAMVDGVDEAGNSIKVPAADKIIDSIRTVKSPFSGLEEELKSITELDLEKRFKFGEDLIMAMEKADSALGGEFSDLISTGLTDRVFQSKYKKAVEANLFKIETGIQTEALYRINRLAEMNLGFGSGLVGTSGGEFKPSELFKKRNPDLSILGGDIENIAGDYYAMFNELFRFSLQKGMDVKHAGGKSVSGQIVKSISRGMEGAMELWQEISSGKGPFGDLEDFIKTINEVILDRLGTIPTDTIRKELASLGQARGLKDTGPAALAGMERDELIKKVQEVVGFKGFLSEMANQVKEVAVQSTIKGISKLSPEKRTNIGDPETYARGVVGKQINEGGINIREQITVPEFPLYNIRSSNRLTQQAGTFKSRYGDITVPESVQFSREGQESINEMTEKYKQAKATAQNIQDAMSEAMEGMKPGAYSELVTSALNNIHEEQGEIEGIFNGLLDYGYKFQKEIGSEGYLKSLRGRTTSDSNMPDMLRNVLAMSPKDQRKELERLSDLVGVPSLKQEELETALGFGEDYNLASEFRRMAETAVLNDAKSGGAGGVSKEELEEDIQMLASELTNKAKVILEMDRIFDVLAVKAKEGVDLMALFPKPGSQASKILSQSGPKKSYSFVEDMAKTARDAQNQRDVDASLFGPSAGGGAGGTVPPSGGGIAAGTMMPTGGIVPVKIVDIDPRAAYLMRGSGLGPKRGAPLGPAGIFNPEIEKEAQLEEKRDTLRKANFETHSEPEVSKMLQKKAKQLDSIISNWDQHQKSFMDPKFQKIMGQHFPDFDLEEFNKRQQAGADPQKLIKTYYGKLKNKEFFGKGLEFQGGSSLGAGGLSTKDVVDPAKLKTSQIEKIAQHLLGLDKGSLDRYQEAAFGIGTALHAKKQLQLKKDMGDSVAIEKFIYFEPEEIIENMQGAITGQIDMAYKNANDEINKIEDIKTTGESFAKFSTIKKFVPEGETTLEDLLEQDIPLFLRQKLEEYASQLNVYLAGLRQMAKKGEVKIADDLSAEISFIPTEDTDLKTDPVRIKFGFDPDRLKKDMEAVKTARMLIQDYVLHTEKSLEDLPEDLQPIAERLRNRTAGTKVQQTKQVPRRRTPAGYKFEEALTAALGEDDIEKEIEEYVRVSSEIFNFIEGKEGIYTETRKANEMVAGAVAKQTATQKSAIKTNAEAMASAADAMDLGDIDDDLFGRARKSSNKSAEEKIVGATSSFTEPLVETFDAMKKVHESAISAQNRLNKFEFTTGLESMPDPIREALSSGAPPMGPKFSGLLGELEEGGFIGFKEQMTAWKLWRVAMADFMIAQAQEAQAAFELTRDTGKPYTREFETFAARVNKLRDFMTRGFGKKTDIYTTDRRFTADPEDMKQAGMYYTQEEMFRKAATPFEDKDELTRGVFGNLIDKLEAGVMGKPAEEIKNIVNELGELDNASMEVLSNLEMFARQGDEIDKALDFGKIAERARVLRAALSQYSMQNFTDDFQTDIQKKSQVRGLLQYLKQIEQVYGRLDFNKTPGAGGEKLDAGLVKVPGFLGPQQQMGLHRENIQRYREFVRRPQEEGGPEIGDSFSYFARVVDQSGNVMKNVRVDFKKYGEAVDDAGNRIGKFSEVQKDLVDQMQMSGGTFRSATRRVIMWGAAASLVYGGVSALKDSINELADIEMNLAQLRMVMNPLRTDFSELSKSAVGFAKEYGVGVSEVLRGMKIFAQQGLSQAEVIDRTQVSTLAANVTTLSAADATEALTAAMKSYGGELGSAGHALDAWSETEAKHAITAADMANAIKKSAAAAKTAGFTFEELNGVVAGIGSVTRQSGKEIGTAMRFIARRLFSEKGPKALGEIGIPAVTGAGENRRGFDVLSDLSMKWKDLTNAQKLNIAQSIGGTRQYNALIVAMDNWDEVLSAIEHSTNSKGSAERRNLEVMKTYSKQLEQTKAVATELQMELGKFVFPIFKGGLAALRTLLELINNIPAPVKAAGVALTLFFSYAAKGIGIFDTISGTIDKGISAFSNFFNVLKSQAGVGLFEIFGPDSKSIPFLGDLVKDIDTTGLKSLAAGVEDALTPKGATMMEKLGDFHSGLGKLAFVLKGVGGAYNDMITDALKSTESFGKSGAEVMDKFNDKFQKAAGYAQGLAAVVTPGMPLDDYMAGMANVLGAGLEGMEQFLFRGLESMAGKGARVFAEQFAASNAGLFKTLLPLGATITGIALSWDELSMAWARAAGSAEDYAKAMHNVRDSQAEDIKEVRSAISAYEALGNKLEEIQTNARKFYEDPESAEKRVEFGTYKDPLLELMRVQEQARDVAFDFLKSNLAAVQGVDKFGNVILSNTDNLKGYMKSLENTRMLTAAMTDADITFKAIEDLTTEGSPLFRELGDFLSQIPMLGDIDIGRTPLRVLNETSEKMNKLLSIRNQFPLSTVLEEESSRVSEALDKIRKTVGSGVADVEKRISSIDTRGLSTDQITDFFLDERFTPGFNLIIDYKRISENLGRTVDAKDYVGSEILKRVVPEAAAFLDVDARLIEGKVREAGHRIRKSLEGIRQGDVVSFLPEQAELAGISGNFAVAALNDSGKMILKYFDTFNNKVVEMALDDDKVKNMADALLPVHRLVEEMEDRVKILSTSLTGAAAGIVGLDEKAFKKDFDLGPRFFSDVPTTSLIQTSRGYAPGVGYTQNSPYDQIDIFSGNAGKQINTLDKVVEKFFLEPLERYNLSTSKFKGLETKGLDAEDVNLAKSEYEELRQIQKELANNQVAVQYIALFKDLTKTMEAQNRALQENVALEEMRMENFKNSAGLLAGFGRGLETLDLGVRDVDQLSLGGKALREVPGYKDLAKTIKTLEVELTGQEAQLENVQRTMTQLGQLEELYKGLGVTMDPKDMEKLAVSIQATGDKGLGVLNDSTMKVKESVDSGFNETVGILTETRDSILSSMGDEYATVALEDRNIKYLMDRIESGQSVSLLSRALTGSFGKNENIGAAIEEIGEVRDRARETGNQALESQADAAITKLSEKLLSKQGLGGVSENILSLKDRVGVEGSREYGLFRSVSPSEIIAKGMKSLKGDIENVIYEGSPIKIASTLDTLSAAREDAIDRGDIPAVKAFNEQLDALSIALADGVGIEDLQRALNLAGAEFITVGEVYQRVIADTGSNMKDFMNRLGIKKTGYQGYGEGLDGEDRLDAILSGESKNFTVRDTEQFKELNKTIQNGVKLQSRGLLNTTNLVKGSAAAVIFSRANSKASSKTLDNLNEQLKTNKEALQEAKDNNEPLKKQKNIELDIIAINEEIKKESKKLKMNEMAATFATVTGGSAALARALKQNEKLFSMIGGSGVSLYLAMKSTSAIMGEELPGNFKEMNKVVKEAIAEFAKTQEVSEETKSKIASEGRKLSKSFGKEFKDITGDSLSDFKENIQQRIKDARARGESLDEPEIRRRAAEFATKSGVDVNKIQTTVLAVLASAAAGYLSEKGTDGADQAQLRRAAEAQNEAFERLILSEPELIRDTLREIKEAYSKASTDVPTAPPEQIEKAILDVGKVRQEIEGSLMEIFDVHKEAVHETLEELKKLKDLASEIQLYVDLKSQLDKLKSDITNIFEDIDVSSRLTGPAMLNPGLRGFPGEVELPMKPQDMSPQQRLFSDLFKSMLDEGVGTFEEGLATPAAKHNDYIRSIQEGIRTYSASFQVNERLKSQLDELRAKRRNLINSEEDSVNTISKMDDVIGTLEKTIEGNNSVMRAFGTSLRIFTEFNAEINKFGDALDSVRVDEAIESLDSFKDYKNNFDKLLGGSHPDALRMVSVMEELDAARAGVSLGPVATNYDVQKAQLQQQLRTAEGSDRSRIAQQLSLMPEQRERDIFAREQQAEDERLRRQATTFEQFARDLERYATLGGLDDGQAASVREMRDYVLDATARAQEVMSGPDGPTYRGFGDELPKLMEMQRAISSEMRDALPTPEMLDMRSSVTDPIVTELKEMKSLLAVIAKDLAPEETKKAMEMFGPKGPDNYPKPFGPKDPNRPKFSGTTGEWQEKPTFWQRFMRNAMAKDEMGFGTGRSVPITPNKKSKYEDDIFGDMAGFKKGGGAYQTFPEGMLNGPGTGTSDSIIAAVSSGEYITKKASVDKLESKYGSGVMDYINRKGDLPKLAEGGLIKDLAGWSREQGDYWRDRRLEKTKEGFHTWPGQVLDLPGEWSGHALANIFDFIGAVASPKKTAGKIKSAAAAIKDNPMAAYKAMDQALANEWATGGTNILNPLDQLSVLGAVGTKLPRTTNALTKLSKPLRNQIGAVGDLDILGKPFSKLTLEERLAWVAKQEGVDLSDVKNTHSKLQKDIVGSSKDLPGFGKRKSASNILDVIKSKSESLPKFSDRGKSGIEARDIFEGEHVRSLNMALATDPKLANKIQSFVGSDVEYLAAGSDAVAFLDKSKGLVHRLTKAKEITDKNLGDFNDLPFFTKTHKQKKIGDYFISTSDYKPGVGKVDKNKFSAALEKLPNAVRDTDQAFTSFYIQSKKSGDWYSLTDLNSQNLALNSKTGKASIIDPGSYRRVSDKEELAKIQTLMSGKVGASFPMGGKIPYFKSGGLSDEVKDKLIKEHSRNMINAPEINPEASGAGPAGMFYKMYNTLAGENAGNGTTPEFFNPLSIQSFAALKNKYLDLDNTKKAKKANKWSLGTGGGEFGGAGASGEWSEAIKSLITGPDDVMLSDPSDPSDPLGHYHQNNNKTKAGALSTLPSNVSSFEKMGPGGDGTFWIQDKDGNIVTVTKGQYKEIASGTVEKFPMGGKIPYFADGGKAGHYYVGDSSGAYKVSEEEYRASTASQTGPVIPEGRQAIHDRVSLLEGRSSYKQPAIDQGRFAGTTSKFGVGTAMRTSHEQAQNQAAVSIANVMAHKFEFKPQAPIGMNSPYAKDLPGQHYKSLTDRVGAALPKKESPLSVDYSKELMSGSVAAARRKYGNVQGDLLSKYRKLKFALENDDTVADQKGFGEDAYYSMSPGSKLNTMRHLLSKPSDQWTPLEKQLASKAIKDNTIDAFDLMAADKRARKDYGFNAMAAHVANPGVFAKYNSAKEHLGVNHPMTKELLEQLKGSVGSKKVTAMKLLTDPRAFKRAKEIAEARENRAIADEEFALRFQRIQSSQKEAADVFGKKPGYGMGGSVPKFAGGGIVKRDGMVFAHGGEVILPKGMAAGGAVETSMNSATLRIEGGDELASKIIKAIENAEPKSVRVDTDGIMVPVDTEGAMVSIDTSSIDNIGTSISNAIEGALSNVSLDTGTNSVGADRLDELSETITNVQDKVFVVKDDVDKLRKEVDDKMAETITTQTLQSAVKDTVQSAIQRVETDITNNQVSITRVESDVRRMDSKYEYRVDEARRIANQADTLARRNG